MMEVDTPEKVEESRKITETIETPAEEEPAPDSNKTRVQDRGSCMGRGSQGGRGGRAMMIKGVVPPGRGRGRSRDGFMNGFGPIRRGMGRPLPYPDMRGRKGGRGGPMGMNMGPPPPPPPPMHVRRPPPMHRYIPL
ncbi:hypothetical protein NFI96_015783 [Prochilodus magdalenae]|nr:hypothetical protein NFI96_015783 [Prochilodus magdalenae]